MNIHYLRVTIEPRYDPDTRTPASGEPRHMLRVTLRTTVSKRTYSRDIPIHTDDLETRFDKVFDMARDVLRVELKAQKKEQEAYAKKNMAGSGQPDTAKETSGPRDQGTKDSGR